MSYFRVICKARSYSVLPEGINTTLFELKNAKGRNLIRIRNNKALNLIGKSFSNELQFECDINASEIFEAIAIAKGEIERILDELAFIIGSPAYDIKVFKAYDITPNIDDRMFVQFYYDVLDKVGSKTTNITNINLFVDGFFKASNERIYRSVHWYRKSLNEFEPLDKFVYLWVGLETLNPIFQNMFPKELERSKCENCGFEKESKGTSALKAFFREIIKDEKLYSIVREMRQVLHGHKALNDIIEQAIEVNPKLIDALKIAICTCIGIDAKKLEYKINTAESEPIVFIFIAMLSNLEVDESNPNFEEPDFTVDIKIESKDEHLVFKPIISTKIMDKGIQLGGLDWGLIGETGYPCDKMQIELRA